jgi:hypothetical protein
MVKRREFEKQVVALLPDAIGAAEVGRLLTEIMRRASWNQDVLDKVLAALEIPFAARKQRLQTIPIVVSYPVERRKFEQSISCGAGRHSDCDSKRCGCVCHQPIDARIRR